MVDYLDPDRLKTLNTIMTQYGSHIVPGNRIRLSVEGDPCTPYRSASDAPTAVVQDILEQSSKLTRFTARLDGSGSVQEYSTLSYDPKHVWELHPDEIDAFTERVFRGETESAPEAIEAKLSDVEEKFTKMMSVISERLAKLEDSETYESFRGGDQDYRQTMASTIRALAGDIMRCRNGESLEFVHKYVDRYDDALRTRDGDYRGSSGTESMRESSSLTDDE